MITLSNLTTQITFKPMLSQNAKGEGEEHVIKSWE